MGHPKMSIQTHVKRRLVIVEKYHSLIVLNCDLKRSKKGENNPHTHVTKLHYFKSYEKNIPEGGLGIKDHPTQGREHSFSLYQPIKFNETFWKEMIRKRYSLDKFYMTSFSKFCLPYSINLCLHRLKV